VAWRSVVVSNPARLKRDKFSLVVEQENVARVPFEDIAVIVLDHREISLTHPVLSACGEYGIALYSTGSNHQPNGVYTPFLSHSRATRMLRYQLGIDRPTAKRAWAEIVRVKIANQAECLRLAGKSELGRLLSYARRVRSGDAGNLEAQAAGAYFPALFGGEFSRDEETWRNAALNYGYAVLRGAIARALVAHGLLPSIGLFHRSEQNAFNLADDLIEPFRPLVDLHVVHNAPTVATPDSTLLPAEKAGLVALLNADVRMPRGEMTVLAAVEQATEGLVRMYEGESVLALELPTLIGLRQHLIDA
jgi:CRISP-associated protein Cas1